MPKPFVRLGYILFEKKETGLLGTTTQATIPAKTNNRKKGINSTPLPTP